MKIVKSMAIVILFAMVASLMGASARAQQPTAAALLNPNWCSDVPASPPPPNLENHPGEWAEIRQLCMRARKGDTGCDYACGGAKERWSLQKAGRLNQPNTFPSPTDKPQRPFLRLWLCTAAAVRRSEPDGKRDADP